MHFVATLAFSYAGVSYNIGDGIYGTAYSAILGDPNYVSYLFYVVPVSDSSTSVSYGSTSTGGPSDMPFTAGFYNIPAGASTSGVFSATPVRILSITNTDSAAQGACIALFDCTNTSAIPSSHQIGSWQLGASETINYQYLTTTGLCWQIKQGNGGATALNSTGSGVDIPYAAS